MNTHKHRLLPKNISTHLLCALTWVNVLLALLLVVQQKQESRQAYLLHRMPGNIQFVQKTTSRMTTRHRLVQTVALESYAPITDIRAKDIHVTVRSSAASVSSLRIVFAKPYLDKPTIRHPVVPIHTSTSAASFRSSAVILHRAADRAPVASSLRPRIHSTSLGQVPAPDSPRSSISSTTSISSISSVSLHPSADAFPAFGNAVHPVSEVPAWGEMTTPAQWNRSYAQLDSEDFVAIPSYDLGSLMIPMSELTGTRNQPDTIKLITAKLYYSTRYFGAYDLDAGEFSAVHPGIDLKLADGTPIGSVAGGRVHDVRRDDHSLGLHVIIEHRAPDGRTYYSVYGHLAVTTVKTGDAVQAGQTIGTVGMTGNTTGPHLHLQIDRGEPDEDYHSTYWPSGMPSKSEAVARAINPITFIRQY